MAPNVLQASINPPALDAAALSGIYVAREVTSTDSTKRNLTLVLRQEGNALLVTEFVGRGTIVERGTWRDAYPRAEIILTDLDGQAIHLRMIFELRGDEMVYVGPDPFAFGTAGISLGRMENGESADSARNIVCF